jgi:hypothetical protein
MPDAIAGDGDSSGYFFTYGGTAAEVQSYYEREMANRDWSLLGAGSGGNDAVLLIFLKDGASASVSILPHESGVILVLLVK